MSLTRKLSRLKQERASEERARLEAEKRERAAIDRDIARYDGLLKKAEEISKEKIQPLFREVQKAWLGGKGRTEHHRASDRYDAVRGGNWIHLTGLIWDEWEEEGAHGCQQIVVSLWVEGEDIVVFHEFSRLDPEDRDFVDTLGDRFFAQIESGKTGYSHHPDEVPSF